MAGHLRFKDRVTIVTGGARGIGYGIAKVFVQNGSKVVFCDIKVESGEQVEKDLNAEGPGECLFVKCDVMKEDEVKNLVDKTIEKYGRLDCLVNNAGGHPPHMSIDKFSAVDMDYIFKLNLMSFFLASKFALPHLRKTQGSIINNGSLVAILGQLHAVTYATTKGGIMSMTRAMAIDEAEYNVRVNSFSPGNIDTPLWREGAKNSDNYDESIRNGKRAQLLGRFGTVEECGQVCLFLAAEATFCTGININVSGGAELNYGNKTRVPVD